MNRLMIIARLREGVHEEAEALIAGGPPFDSEELGFHRHGAYLTATEVIFFFEAPEVEWIVNDIIDDPAISAGLRAVAGAHRGDATSRSRALLLVTRVEQARRRARRLGGVLRQQSVSQRVPDQLGARGQP